MNRIFTLLILLCATSRLFAVTERYTQRVDSAALYIGAEFELFDDKYYEMSSNVNWDDDFTNDIVRNRIHLGINPEVIQTVSSSGSVDIDIYYEYWNGSAFVWSGPVSRTLYLEYDVTDGEALANDLSTYVFNGAHRIKVEITDIDGLDEDLIYLESEIEVERYYTFDGGTVSGASYSEANSYITFEWDHRLGAEFYELEWVHINDMTLDSGTYVSSSDLSYDYYHNATRIALHANHYRIPKLFDHGYVLFRVRAIGAQGSDFDKRYEGEWSATESGTVASHPSGQRIAIATDYDYGMNWVHQVAYTEEGKRMEAVSFSDGLGRGRQTVAHNTVTNQAVVSNVYYDELGRPVISDLPTPLEQDSLKHYPDFNRADSVGYPSYMKDYFDILALDSCDVDGAWPFSDQYGAGKYYSPNNTNKDSENANIPDAERYPFTRVTYREDYTGRVDRVSGAGSTLRLGQGHETRYVYPSPNQYELNRLFGSEVGDATHYTKMITIDPNGQIYAQYSDLAGRVVASYMMGPSPGNLDTLVNNTGDSALMVLMDGGIVDLSVSYPQTIFSYFEYISENNETYTFDYSFTPQQFESACLDSTLCLDCVYDMSISITDECGIVYWDSTATIYGDTFDLVCHGDTNLSFSEAVVLPSGYYTINKTLTVNQDAINEYWCMYLENDTCMASVSDYFNVLYAQDSFPACQTDTLDFSDTTTSCDYSREAMLDDMTPGGQYAEYADSSGFLTSDDPTSIFYTDDWEEQLYLDANGDTIWVVNSVGDTVMPHELSEDEFIAFFDDTWAETLLPLHPEYCYLVLCESMDSIDTLDLLMQSVYTFNEACSLGLTLPLSTLWTPNWSYHTCTNTTMDPYFDTYPGSMFLDSAIYYSENFTEIDGTVYDMAEAAILAATCPDVTTATAANSCIELFRMDTCNLDLAWTIFRSYYQDMKSGLQFQAAQYYADSVGCSNACIGSDSTGCEDYADKLPRFGNLEAYFSADAVTNVDSLQNLYNTTLAGSCDSLCASYADDWMEQLSSCDTASLTLAELDSMRVDFIELCMSGCDAEYPFGTTTTPPGDTTASGFTTIGEILEHYYGGAYEDELCSELLIGEPGPYGSQGNFDLITAPLDTCACDAIYQAQADLPGNPYGYTVLEQMLAHNTGVSLDDANYLLCHCDKVTNGSWPYSWSAYDNITLAALEDNLPIGLSCSSNASCHVTCSDILAEMDTLLERFDHVTDFEQTTNYEQIVSNYLNNEFAYNLNYQQYYDFIMSCGSSDTAAYCTITPEAEELPKVLSLLAMRGHLTHTYVDAVALIDSNIVYANGVLQDGYSSDIYWSSSADSTLTVYLDSGNCAIEFTAWDGFDYSSIVQFGELVPTVNNCDTLGDFVVGIKYIDCGIIQNGTLTGSSDCFAVNNCVCDSTGLVLCDELPDYGNEQPCYEPYLTQMVYNALNQYEAAVDSAYIAFGEAYNAACAGAFDTELLSYSGKIRTYQYTLFYYDQAGNLIQTVAPKGKDDSFVATDATINAARDGVTNMDTYVSAVTPSHDYKTTYKYNSYNQLVETTNPDQDGDTRFWYDRYGRIAASQNPVQADEDLYSYTFYDVQGRPIEVGQVEQSNPLLESDLKADDLGDDFRIWVEAGTRTEVTKTTYDRPLSVAISTKFKAGTQKQLRLRVATVAYYATYGGGTTDSTDYESAVHYSYDVHGNVIETLQDVPLMAPVNQDIKSTQYEFELISGNVKKVIYQEDKLDYMHHEYEYDALNRLTEVHTSTDTVHNTREAHYRYYDYGPLARVELGKDKVQGMDYAYTIQGWIKSMNASTLNKFRDMGRDGNNGSSVPYAAANTGIHSLFAKDVVGYTIGYFDNDYTAIGVSSMEATYSGTNFGNGSDELYNGNIRHLVSSIDTFTTLGSVYRYDQLQRLKNMSVYYLGAANSWSGITGASDYNNSYTYDENGNLNSLWRLGTDTNEDLFDMLNYYYTTVGGNPSNRLDYVDDGGDADGTAGDILDGQTTGNYGYDKIGQLLSDDSESISAMSWRFGDKKLQKIEHDDADSPQIEFIYNPFGQRVIKIVKPRSSYVLSDDEEWTYTYYAYDANGQVMGVYDVDLSATSGNIATWTESSIYGASRIGQIKPDKVIYYYYTEPNYNNGGTFVNSQGLRNYEVTNYLGNVNAVINDRKLWNSGDTLYEATVLMAADYYPGGMLMPERHHGSSEQRYLYNGMEQDLEVSGNGNSYTTEFRQYDPRLMRWKSLDPLMHIFPSMSPYCAFDNNPIYYIDPYGLSSQGGDGEPIYRTGNVNSKEEKQFRRESVQQAVRDGKDGHLVFIYKNVDNSKGGEGTVTVYYRMNTAEDIATEYWSMTNQSPGIDSGVSQKFKLHESESVAKSNNGGLNEGETSESQAGNKVNDVDTGIKDKGIVNNNSSSSSSTSSGNSSSNSNSNKDPEYEDVNINLNINAKFQRGTSTLTNQNAVKKELKNIAELLKDNPTAFIIIRGSTLVSGDDGWNTETLYGVTAGQLAENRIYRIRRMLVGMGVADEQIKGQLGSPKGGKKFTGRVMGKVEK